MRGNTWRENFSKQITIPCKNEACENFVITTRGAGASQGKYCPDCRKEARRIHGRTQDAKRSRTKHRQEWTRTYQRARYLKRKTQ